jgi:hypothetical protein
MALHMLHYKAHKVCQFVPAAAACTVAIQHSFIVLHSSSGAEASNSFSIRRCRSVWPPIIAEQSNMHAAQLVCMAVVRAGQFPCHDCL